MGNKVLLIEDNEGDIKLIEEAVSDNKLAIDLEVLKDGGHTMQYIEEKQNSDYNNLPELIIMDLNLPKVQGKKLLTVFKGDEVLKKIPIIILTTSNLSADIEECFQSGANAYLIKPIDIIEFFEMISTIYKFWFQTSCLPQLN